MIKYKNGDMFANMKPGSIYLHACNAKNNWGAGVALKFKQIFPDAYKKHQQDHLESGRLYEYHDRSYTILCPVTSCGYGKFRDRPGKIIMNTYQALSQFARLDDGFPKEVNMPKINSGYFGVPWEYTEAVLDQIDEDMGNNITWVVWEI